MKSKDIEAEALMPELYTWMLMISRKSRPSDSD